VAHHRQVVGDEQIGQGEALFQLHEKIDDLRLDRNIEGAHWFVANEHLGFEGQGAGNADALALTAGELVGVAVDVTGIESDHIQQGHGAQFALLGFPAAVDREGLC
jgi:hypothetical protein